MAHLSFVLPEQTQDPQVRALFEEAFTRGTPKPEAYGIMAHQPEVMKAWAALWKACFLEGVVDHPLKELVRIYIARLIECEY